MPSRHAARTAIFGVALSSTFTLVPAGAVDAFADVDLTKLKKAAKQASDAVEKATKAMESRRRKVDKARTDLNKKIRALTTADTELRKARAPVTEIAAQAYTESTGMGLGPIMATSEDSRQLLRFVGDLEYIAVNRQAAVGKAYDAQEKRKRLAIEAQGLRSSKLLDEAKLSTEVERLKKKSEKAVKALTAGLSKLGVKIGKGQNCDPSRGGEAEEYPNGLLPKNYLCPLPQRGEVLRADAAVAFIELNAAYKARFKRKMCVTDSYRDLAGQHEIFRRKPGMAAVPGKSNHGWGLAVDLCGGVQNSGSPQFNWLERNARTFGWFHPDWAYSNPFEPWHWEYDPKLVR